MQLIFKRSNFNRVSLNGCHSRTVCHLITHYDSSDRFSSFSSQSSVSSVVCFGSKKLSHKTISNSIIWRQGLILLTIQIWILSRRCPWILHLLLSKCFNPCVLILIHLKYVCVCFLFKILWKCLIVLRNLIECIKSSKEKSIFYSHSWWSWIIQVNCNLTQMLITFVLSIHSIIYTEKNCLFIWYEWWKCAFLLQQFSMPILYPSHYSNWIWLVHLLIWFTV